MSDQLLKKRIERRKFLGAIAAAGTTAAVAAAIAAPVAAEVEQSAKPEGSQEGYRETAHIRRYYETARF